MKKCILLLCLLNGFAAGFAQTKRVLKPEDIYRLQQVSSAQVSPDGKWVVYVVSTVDSAKDKRDDNIWMISWDGKE